MNENAAVCFGRSNVGCSEPLRVPSSKSLCNRALICAALARGRSSISNFSSSDDSRILLKALRDLGVGVEEREGEVELSVDGSVVKSGERVLDLGAAGTSMRFATAFAAASGAVGTVLRGSERMHQRPIGDLVGALEQAGASVEYLGTVGCPPIRIVWGVDRSTKSLWVDGSVSSQFLSALLLVSAVFNEELSIHVEEGLVSRSYVEMTLEVMAAFGVEIKQNGENTFVKRKGAEYSATNYRVEGDASGACYLWAIGALTGREVSVAGIRRCSLQGDLEFLDVLERMGCTVLESERGGKPVISVCGPDQLLPVEVDMVRMPDAAQTLSVLAAFAKGRTVLKGVQTLAVKETDRLAALVNELGTLGIECIVAGDQLEVVGGVPNFSRPIRSYDDHRMAMSFAVAGARIEGLVIESPGVVSKSFPDFWGVIRKLGVAAEYA